MPLSPGTKLGQYEVVEAIGAGGMGEVYRARDPKLGREVASKGLPDDLRQDSECLTRFEREAQKNPLNESKRGKRDRPDPSALAEFVTRPQAGAQIGAPNNI